MNKIYFVLIFSLLQNCSTPGQNRSSDPKEYLEGKWILQKIDGKKINASSRIPYLTFDRSKARISGFGGCNGFSGNFKLAGRTIKIGSITLTKMACPQLNIENTFLYIINNSDTSIEVTQNTLFLRNRKGKLVFEKIIHSN